MKSLRTKIERKVGKFDDKVSGQINRDVDTEVYLRVVQRVRMKIIGGLFRPKRYIFFLKSINKGEMVHEWYK